MTSPHAARRHDERRRPRMAVAVGTCVVVVAMVGSVAVGIALLGGSDDDGPSGAAATSTSTTEPASTTAAPTTSASPAAEPPSTSSAMPIGRTYPVATSSTTFVDTSRSTSPNGNFAGAPTRTLPTQFWYPAEADGGTPARGDGPYPLVVFSHGYDVTPDFYRPLLERWAAAGYVVAAPTYPILSGSDGGTSHVDYEKTFADASFVISQVLTFGNDDPLAGMIDPHHIAAAGHSDGEVIAFGVGFMACCRDPRVESVIAMAGDLSLANNPHVRDTRTPILHIMERNDEYDPYPHSIQWDRDNLTAPRWMVSLDSSHVPPYTQPGDPAFELVSSVTVAYLDGTLKGHPERLDEMVNDVSARPAVGTIER